MVHQVPSYLDGKVDTFLDAPEMGKLLDELKADGYQSMDVADLTAIYEGVSAAVGLEGDEGFVLDHGRIATDSFGRWIFEGTRV